MYITLRQLEIFQAAAKFLNFAKAAESLCMSPPAVTKQIQSLEKECRCHFFEQVGRVIYLTEEGKQLLEQVSKIDFEMQNLRRLVLDLSHESKQIINLSFGHTFENLIFKAIHTFKKTHPSVTFNIFVESRADQYKNLELNNRDLCITCLPDRGIDFAQIKLFDIGFVLVTSIHNPILSQATISTQKIKNEPLILLKASSVLEDKAYKLLNQARMQNQDRLILDSYVAVKDAIIAGLGIGFLPKSLIEEKDAKDLAVLPVRGLSYNAPLMILHRRHKKLTPLMLEFVTMLKKLKH